MTTTTTKALLCIALAGLGFSCTTMDDDNDNSDRVVPPGQHQPLPSYANQLGATPQDPTTLDEFSGCMTFANFTQAGMFDAWNLRQVTNSGESCDNCHAPSNSLGFLPPDNAQAFFDLVSQHRRPLGTYYAPAPTTIDINEATFGVLQGAPPHVEHPQADLSTVHAASAQFLDLSLDVARRGQCGPSTLVD